MTSIDGDYGYMDVLNWVVELINASPSLKKATFRLPVTGFRHLNRSPAGQTLMESKDSQLRSSEYLKWQLRPLQHLRDIQLELNFGAPDSHNPMFNTVSHFPIAHIRERRNHARLSTPSLCAPLMKDWIELREWSVFAFKRYILFLDRKQIKDLDLVFEHQQKIKTELTAAWHAYNKGDKETFEQVRSELKMFKDKTPYLASKQCVR